MKEKSREIRFNQYLLTSNLLFLGIIIIFYLLSFNSCHKPRKFAFGKEDTLKVLTELKNWRGTLKHYQFLEFTESPLILTSPLLPKDTFYQGGPEIKKIAHLLSFWRTTADTFHLDSLFFFTDSLNPKDTFCQVIYNDSTRHTIAIFKYDSLWQIRFRDSVTIETIMKTGYLSPQEEEKIYPLVGKREIHLKKEGSDYKLKKLSGFYFSHIKDSSPNIELITLTQEGRSALIKPEDLRKPIPLDSLPSFSADRGIVINISCEAPSDTINCRYFGLLFKEGERQFLGEGYNFSKEIIFNQEGKQSLFIEVIPSTNIFYPDRSYYYTILAIPISITP